MRERKAEGAHGTLLPVQRVQAVGGARFTGEAGADVLLNSGAPFQRNKEPGFETGNILGDRSRCVDRGFLLLRSALESAVRWLWIDLEGALREQHKRRHLGRHAVWLPADRAPLPFVQTNTARILKALDVCERHSNQMDQEMAAL